MGERCNVGKYKDFVTYFKWETFIGIAGIERL